MSDKGSNQSVASQLAKIKIQLECPVCLNIPRDLPLPSCPSGHIVCRPCKERVEDCPTCRQPMPPNMINSLVGGLIEHVEHKCKYSDQGCKVKMMLKDLQLHETNCPERAIKCPYNFCGTFVKLRDINEHFLNSSFPHSVLVKDGHLSFLLVKWWRTVCVKVHDEMFHVSLQYSHLHKCFALSVWSSPAAAAKYLANLKISDNEKEININGLRITSVDDVPSIDQCISENGKHFWCIPMAENFTMKKLESDGRVQSDWLHVTIDVKNKC